jgi:hypothetical protein
MTVPDVLIAWMVGGMIGYEAPNVVPQTVSQDNLRPPGIVEGKAAHGRAALIHQREALGFDLVEKLRLCSHRDRMQAGGQHAARESCSDAKHKVPFFHAISPKLKGISPNQQTGKWPGALRGVRVSIPPTGLRRNAAP